MRPPQAMTHGHVALVGQTEDDEDEEPMAWTPENDPDQMYYNRLPPENEDDEDEPVDEQDDGQSETEDAPPEKASVTDAAQAIVQAARERFSQVRTMGMPPGLRRKNVMLALFVQSDGRVKVLR